MTTKKSTTKSKSNGKKEAYPSFTPALVDRVLKLHDEGKGMKAISDELDGYPTYRVWKILALSGRTKNSPDLMKRAKTGDVPPITKKAAPKKTKAPRAKATASV